MRRSSALASRKLARFTHAISSTVATTVISSAAADWTARSATGCSETSLDGTTVSARFVLLSGYVSVSRRENASSAYQQKGSDPRAVAYLAPEQIAHATMDERRRASLPESRLT